MKRVVIISITILIVMYSISLFPVFEIDERIRNEQYKINSAKNVDLSSLNMNGENFLENRSKYYFGSKSASLVIHKQGECGNEDFFKRYPKSILDKVSIGEKNFDSIECIMNYLGNDYIRGFSFKGIENYNAYFDKNNNIMLLINNDYYPSAMSTWIILKDIEIYQFYREPIFHYGPLALFDPLRTHFVATFYPIVDRIILPLYYMFLIFPFIIKLSYKDLSKKKIVKYWIKLNIAIIIIAIVFYILEIGLMMLQ